jgi:protein involved in polysaccharide export with SLBB domain
MPGLFELKSEATVLDMIAKAQGLNEFADRGSIKVIRRGQQGAINFRYNDAINGRNDANFFVQPGDVIVVQ